MERKLTAASFNVGKIKAEDRSDMDNLPHECRSCWYLSRKEIEYNSPSRKDGIDSRKEAQLRMLYCSFLQDVGIRLKIPQVTIATAMMLCHRFYLHQSHAKNEWQTIATVCMFLASKVEDTPCRLDKVIIVAYETMYQRDPAALQRIHQEDVFTKQKALILVGERLLLCTIGFDFNIQHPYKPLHEAFKKLQITQKDVRQTAWNFVNVWLRTTLCLQYKPHYIAAGSLYLAAKHHNMKLPSQNGYGWWQELNISPQQLDAIVQQMTELLGYKRQPVVSALVGKLKPVKSPIAAKAKEEVVSSPDSCVLSGPGSSVRSPNHAVNDRGSVSRLTDPSDHSSSKCSLNTENPGELRNSESPNSDVEDSDQIGDAHNKINVDRIRALMRARKRSRECSKSTIDVELSEDALIEKELEAGVELAAGRYEKKQRLLEVL